MDRLGAGRSRRLQHALDIEIAVARPRRSKQHGLVGLRDMHRAAIRLRIDRNRAQTHGARGADHPAGDLAAIGDQECAEAPV